jgi:outer membrane protein assembly factor BamB
MKRTHHIVTLLAAALFTGAVAVAQVGRGWSDWPTPYADAQRTSWLRTDPKISVESLSKSGFDIQWTSKLDELGRSSQQLTQGVTASGVTLFVPVSIIAGANKLYMVDNDTGHIVWSRAFETLPPTTGSCGGGSSAPTRIVSGVAEPTPVPQAAPPPAAAVQGYRSLLGEPGEGIPVEPRPPGARGGPPGPPGPPGTAARPGAAAPVDPRRGPGPPIPGAPPNAVGGGLGRTMVGYTIAADGQLHVVGLQSGKDLQKPAPFLPANTRWSNPLAVGNVMYATTSGTCAGAPTAVYAIDLDAAAKPVVSYHTNGGSIVGSVAFSSDGTTLLAAIGPGAVKGDGKANAIVALDPITLRIKDWFTQPTAEFVTGPTVFRHGTRDVVAASTKDGRVILLDAASLGGTRHDTPLLISPALFETGGSIAAEALATWARPVGATAAGARTDARWLLVPISGRPSGGRATNGAIRSGAVVALRVAESNGKLSLEPEWTSNDLIDPATPIIVNGVVFALSSGQAPAAGRNASRAVLYAYDGASGKTLWNSASSMAAPATSGSYWSGLSQIYVGADDGTVYSFGFLDERR